MPAKASDTPEVAAPVVAAPAAPVAAPAVAAPAPSMAAPESASNPSVAIAASPGTVEYTSQSGVKLTVKTN